MPYACDTHHLPQPCPSCRDLTHIGTVPVAALIGTVAVLTWRDRPPSVKQLSVFVDRGWPKPKTRGEAADILKRVADREGWT